MVFAATAVSAEVDIFSIINFVDAEVADEEPAGTAFGYLIRMKKICGSNLVKSLESWSYERLICIESG